MRNIRISPRVALVLGALLYLVCLWRACPRLDDKGYFLAILVLGGFAIAAYQQATSRRFAQLCRLVLLLASGLLLVGIWNMPLALPYKAFCVATWFISMYAVAACSAAAPRPAN